MFNIYTKIPSNIKPPFSRKMHELGIYHDPQVRLLLEILYENMLEEEFDDKEELMDLSREESICVGIDINNKEETFLGLEEISYLLDKEYERYVQKNDPNFFQSKQTNGLGHIQGLFDEENDDSQGNNTSGEYIHSKECNRKCVIENPFEIFLNPQYHETPHECEEMIFCESFFSPSYEIIDYLGSEGEMDLHSVYRHEETSENNIYEDIIPENKTCDGLQEDKKF